MSKPRFKVGDKVIVENQQFPDLAAMTEPDEDEAEVLAVHERIEYVYTLKLKGRPVKCVRREKQLWSIEKGKA